MSFIETPRFPVDLGYGSTGGPSFSTDIIVTGGGVEYRNANWSLPLARYNAKYNCKLRSTAIEIYEFFMSAKGRFGGFRVKDLWDYTSAANGVDAPTDTDQTIGTGDGATTTFQLVKNYTQGAATIARTIKKPVSSTVLISVNGVGKTEGVDYTVSYTTGIVTMTAAPTAGHLVKSGFEFDVPCRFDTDSLDDLYFTIMSSAGSNTDIVNYPDIPIIEVRV